MEMGRALRPDPGEHAAGCGSSGIGPTLHYQVAEKRTASTFHELFQSSFGTQDLEFVRIAATPGDSPDTVEVIWGDLTVRAEELPGWEGDATLEPRNTPR